jgi:hypothetical protein
MHFYIDTLTFNNSLTLVLILINNYNTGSNCLIIKDNHNGIFNPGNTDNASFMSGHFDTKKINHGVTRSCTHEEHCLTP